MQRLKLPILVPLGALIATATVILTIGLLLLWVGDYKWNGEAVAPWDFVRLAVGDYPRSELHGGKHDWDLGLFSMNAPVIVAMLVAVAVLGGATLASWWGRGRQG
jgi:hypothetical protein